MAKKLPQVTPEHLKEVWSRAEKDMTLDLGSRFLGLYQHYAELGDSEQTALKACLVRRYLGGDIVRVGYRTKNEHNAYYFNILPNGEKFDLYQATSNDMRFIVSRSDKLMTYDELMLSDNETLIHNTRSLYYKKKPGSDRFERMEVPLEWYILNEKISVVDSEAASARTTLSPTFERLAKQFDKELGVSGLIKTHQLPHPEFKGLGYGR